MRALIAFCIGLCLMTLRAPLGVDLFEIPAVDPVRAYRVRAFGFVVAFLAVSLTPKRFDGRVGGADLLFGGLAGVLVGGLGLPYPRTAYEFTSWALAILVVVVGVDAWRTRATPRPDLPRTSPRVVLGCVLGGAGAALGLEGQARYVRRLALDMPGDDAVFAGCLALCLALGGVAFGRLAAREEGDRRRRALAFALVASALCAHLGMAATRGLVTPRGLRAFVRRFGSDLSLSGTFGFDALVGVALFLVPAFGVGAALYLAKRRAELAALLAGAAIGLALIPVLLADAPASGVTSAHVVRYGEWALLAGGLVVGVSVRGLGGVTAVAAAGALLFVGSGFLPVPKAWVRFPKDPSAVLEIAAGQIWVEPSLVSLDQRRMTPATGAGEDIRLALTAALGADTWSYVGLPTSAIRRRVAEDVTFVGAWSAPTGAGTQTDVARLLGARPVELARREWAQRGGLVVVPPASGGAPLVPTVEAPDGGVAIAWFDAGTPVSQSAIEGRIVLASDGFADLCIGVVYGLDAEAPEPLHLLEAGAPAPRRWPLGDLRLREEARPDVWRARMCRRLGAANAPARDFFEALAEHYEMQVASSPFESTAEQVELDEGVLTRLRDASLALGRRGYVDRLWRGIARTLVEKRAVALIQSQLEPLAAAWTDAVDLHVALAVADLEGLDPDAARDRLAPYAERAIAAETLAVASGQLGDHARAAELWRRVGAPYAARELALSLLRAGDDAGRNLAQRLLLVGGLDVELRRALNGDFDPVPRGWPVRERRH